MAGKDHLFRSGVSGNPAGRPVGSRNKLTENFVTALSKDFAAHGVEAIQTARQDDPVAYLRLVASLMPKEVRLSKDNPLDQYSDEEVAALLTAAAGLVEGDPPPSKPSKLH